MSMFSMTSSKAAPRATVSRNGYRFTTTRSMRWILCSFICFSCSGVGRPRMPPCTSGCRVFTRPSSISGKLVKSLTSRTVSPASRSERAVPPVDRISTPSFANRRPRSTTPVLSETEMRARAILLMARLLSQHQARLGGTMKTQSGRQVGGSAWRAHDGGHRPCARVFPYVTYSSPPSVKLKTRRFHACHDRRQSSPKTE